LKDKRVDFQTEKSERVKKRGTNASKSFFFFQLRINVFVTRNETISRKVN
jgi:hypothetical protein